MKFYHLQNVFIRTGFYRHKLGIVHDVSTWRCIFGSEPRYLIFLGMNCTKWFKESDLESAALPKIDKAIDSLQLGPDCKPTRDESGT